MGAAMTLFSLDRALGPREDRKTLPYLFGVPAGVTSLSIDLSYEPAVLEDPALARRLAARALEEAGQEAPEGLVESFLPLKNLVTLSLDDPSGYRGNAHRGENPIHIELTGQTATPGFSMRPVEPGEWRLSLHCHAVLGAGIRLRCLVKGGHA